MARVFAVQDPQRRTEHGLEPVMALEEAQAFGEVSVLLPNRLSAFSTAPMMDVLKEKLKGFSDQDLLVAIGDPSAIAGAVMVAARENRGIVNMLKWDKRNNRYIKVTLNSN